MPVKEASSEETPYGRYVTSDGWFVLNLADALAVRNEEKGGAEYPIEPREAPFRDFGVNVRVLSPGQPSALYHSEGVQEGRESHPAGHAEVRGAVGRRTCPTGHSAA
jgi:hypothetical protein